MQFYDAKVADIIRCAQRDELFVSELQGDIFSIVNALGIKNYVHLRKVVPIVSNVWYYFLTSLSDLQTLGEEYTGTLRFTKGNKTPSNFRQLIWLLFYIGGESFYERFLDYANNKIKTSESLTENAKNLFLKCIKYMKDNKIVFLQLHRSLFYINGKYYSVSNRIAGIKYILLRQWLQDNSSTQSFMNLGRLMLIYLIYTLAQQGMHIINDRNVHGSISAINVSGKLCSLCTETRKDTCITSCGHLYCWNCIYESLKYQQNCPVCREIIHPSRIVLLQNYQ